MRLAGQGWMVFGLVIGMARMGVAQGTPKSVLELTGRGMQVYGCAAGKQGQAPAWVLKRPEAELLDAKGRVVGSHGEGPVWRLRDGSALHGEVVSKKASPDEGAVPWLVLRAVQPEGKGLLSDVTEIRREETHGGAAPASGCATPADIGRESRVPYSAVYRFIHASGQGAAMSETKP